VYLGPMLRSGRRIAAELEALLREHDHPVARALVMPRVARGSGPDGAWTRRDHRWAVVGGAVAFVIGWAIAIGVFSIADRYPAGTRWNSVLTGVGLFFALGGMFLGWQGFKHARAAVGRSSDELADR